MESESRVTRSIIDEIHSSNIQGDQMVDESRVTGSMIVEHQSGDIQGDQKDV